MMWAWLMGRHAKEAVQESETRQKELRAQIKGMQPELARLKYNLERNHVAANVMAAFRGTE